ncbi:MAG: hypothetical protein IT262_22035 [Saprospiraceae bacterium]|nr:hypothetical protein [Saprospiraceae bacterium]
MENSESKLTPEESLLVIHQTIEKAKRDVQDNGFHLLLWGILVVAAGLVDFYMSQAEGMDNKHFAWAILPVIGVPVTILYEWRRQKTVIQRNTILKWYSLVWLGFGISLPMLIAFAVAQHLPPTQPIMVLTGFALFMSGVVLSFRPLVWGAAIVWAGAVACLFTDFLWHSLIMAIAVALGYLIPGFLLQRAKKH